MNQLFVGIDVGSRNNAVYLMKPDGEKHSSFRMQNNRGGAKMLTERIVSAIQSQGLEGVVIGMEATSIYGDSLVYALREDGKLGQYPRKIHVLNPKLVNKFKESYPELPKNDDVDAFVIADKLRFGRIGKEVYIDDYRYKALQTLTRARFYAVQDLTREKQRFANYLFLKCSGIAQDKDIANTSATTLALMERFETVDELAFADLDELTAFIDEKGRNFADPAAKAKAIQAAARNSYRLPVTVNNSVNQAMAVSIATMRALEKQIKVLDKAIEQQFKIIPNTLTSIPGIGKVYSAGIIAEICDIVLFIDHPAASRGGVPPGGGDRGLLLNVVGVAGLPDAAIGPILVPLDPPDESLLFQHGDGLPRCRGGTVTVCRDGFHGRPALPFLTCAAYQETVHSELNWR